MDLKTAIERGDAGAVASLLTEEPDRANQLIAWGERCEIRTHPLHYISDKLFDGTLTPGKELPIVDLLLAAGADCDFQATNGETPLIGAASLAAENVGLRLLEAGARVNLKGAFGETALHWAAIVGLERLVADLIQRGADLNARDARYHSPPLGWAIHGRYHSAPGSRGNHVPVAARLVAAGANVQPEWLVDENVRADADLLAVLKSGASH